ncbi:MAP kinase-activated protein kinase 5-like isoform X2 [Xenia sp. Carnegie-2017]|nr:MAP kinase-activated protein kinase 5-like isoform X2 [Xenia sp. Carnegie-2017]
MKCLTDSSRSRQEAKVHFMCSGHRNVVNVVDAYANTMALPGETRPIARIFLIMEYMEGGELFEKIRNHVYFTEKEAREVAKQIGIGLQHIHSFNVAHRDLKPENLLLKEKTDAIHVKISDFGFAKVDRGDLVTPQFTPYYASPQVLEAQKYLRAQKSGKYPYLKKPYTYDKACDLWSLGVIIYVMLCGYPPFYSDVPSKQMSHAMKRKIASGEYDFPDKEWAKVSDLAKDCINKLLCVEPNRRMNIDQFLDHSWILNDNIPDTVLFTPKIIADEEAFKDAMDGHAVELTNMRLAIRQIRLKPIEHSKNPTLMKRKAVNFATNENFLMKQKPNENEESSELSLQDNSAFTLKALKSLRDIIAYCLMMKPVQPNPILEKFPGDELTGLVLDALEKTQGNESIRNAFMTESWDGEKFTSSVNKSRLAKALSEIMLQAERTSGV